MPTGALAPQSPTSLDASPAPQDTGGSAVPPLGLGGVRSPGSDGVTSPSAVDAVAVDPTRRRPAVGPGAFGVPVDAPQPSGRPFEDHFAYASTARSAASGATTPYPQHDSMYESSATTDAEAGAAPLLHSRAQRPKPLPSSVVSPVSLGHVHRAVEWGYKGGLDAHTYVYTESGGGGRGRVEREDFYSRRMAQDDNVAQPPKGSAMWQPPE